MVVLKRRPGVRMLTFRSDRDLDPYTLSAREGPVLMTAHAYAQPSTLRPVLRGWSHALAVPAAVLFTGALAVRCLGDRPRLASMIVYGLSLILMFGWSAAYHIVTWSPDRRQFMRQVDHANIFLVIAATSTAIGATVLEGWQRIALLAAVWTPTAIGLLLTVLRVQL